jgi:2-dehydropantoate 2-reductase
MRFLIVGAGSTGGYFGGRLMQAGRDVTFLVRPARAQQLRSSGLEILSPHGDVTLVPKLVTADALAPGGYDVVLLTVKAFSFDRAIDDFAPAVERETMILSVLNGMKHIDVLASRFGKHSIVGCVCKVATRVDKQGRIVQLNKLHDLAYGEIDGAPSARTDRLDEAIKAAGFDARLSRTIEQEMWQKWILLATLGGITCLMRGNVGDIEAVPGGSEFVLRFLDEVCAVISANGHPPSEAFLSGTRAQLTQKGSVMTSSMYRDLEQGWPVEAEQILGDLLDRARRASVDTPLLAAAFANLSVYQSRLGQPRHEKLST